jgi:hypothetical protein
MTPGFRSRHSFQIAVPCGNKATCSSFATGWRSQSADIQLCPASWRKLTSAVSSIDGRPHITGP